MALSGAERQRRWRARHKNKIVREFLLRVREPSDRCFFDRATGDLVDMDAGCAYCGGHKFAWQAMVDHLLEGMTP
jgi:hypothetical protein